MDRRSFLRNTGLVALAASTFGLDFLRKLKADTPGDAFPGCLPTSADILGPFYRANAPFRNDLRIQGAPGTELVIQGQVFSDDCITLLENAVVDIWHADDSGAYDNSTPDFRYRGRIETGPDGRYSFTTILPGRYLNGAQYRPAHVHFRVTAPGHTELITQLYFENDPYISTDPWASDPDAAPRILPITAVGGVDTVTFDLFLVSAAMHSGYSYSGPEEAWIRIYPNPAGERFAVEVLEGVPLDAVEIFNEKGQMVGRAYDIGKMSWEMAAHKWKSGIYFVRVKSGDRTHVCKLVID